MCFRNVASYELQEKKTLVTFIIHPPFPHTPPPLTTHAQQVGIDKQTHLNLRQVPEDLLPALETHLSEIDSIRKANAGDARCAPCRHLTNSCFWQHSKSLYIPL